MAILTQRINFPQPCLRVHTPPRVTEGAAGLRAAVCRGGGHCLASTEQQGENVAPERRCGKPVGKSMAPAEMTRFPWQRAPRTQSAASLRAPAAAYAT